MKNLAFIIVCWSALIHNRLAVADDASLRKAFLKEYEPFAKRLRDHYTNVRAKYTFTLPHGKGQAQVIEAEVLYNSCNYRGKNSRQFIDQETKKVIRRTADTFGVRNTLYDFTLVRNQGGEYVVS